MSFRSSFVDIGTRRDLALALGGAALMLLLLTLPLAHVTALRSLGFVVAVLCAAAVYRDRSDGLPRRLPLLWIFVLWLTAALLPLTSSGQAPQTLAIVWDEVIKGALIFYAAFFLARRRQRGARWFFAATAALALLASAAIVDWFQHGSWQASGLVPALGDYNTSALTLLPLVCLPAFAEWRKRLGTAAPVAAGLTTLLAMSAAALSMSRSFWLVAAVMLLTGTLVWCAKRRLQWKRVMLWIGGGLALLALLASVVARWRGTELLMIDTRTVIYGPVIEHLRNAPFVGFGYGHESAQDWYRAHMAEAGVLHAHNIVLSYAEQMGLPGVIALFGIFGGLALAFFRRVAAADAPRASLAALGLALVVGVFVKNNLDIFFTRHNLLLFFLCTGLLLGATEARETPPAPATQ